MIPFKKTNSIVTAHVYLEDEVECVEHGIGSVVKDCRDPKVMEPSRDEVWDTGGGGRADHGPGPDLSSGFKARSDEYLGGKYGLGRKQGRGYLLLQCCLVCTSTSLLFVLTLAYPLRRCSRRTTSLPRSQTGKGI